MNADGIRIFTKGLQHLRLWDVDGETPLGTYERNQRITSVVFSASGSRFITWDESPKPEKNVHLWDAKHNEPRHSFGREDDVGGAVFSPDASRILTWSSAWPEGAARLWDAETGKPLQTFRRHGNIAYGRFTSDGARALTITWDSKAHLWDPSQEEPLRTFRHTALRWSVLECADDGASLIAQGDDQVRRWSMAVDRRPTIEQLQRDHEIKTATQLDAAGHLLPRSLHNGTVGAP